MKSKKGGDKLIIEKTFTIETRLDQKQNQEIIDYAREFNALYSKVLRFAWHRYNNGGHFDRKKSEFNTLLQKRFNINKRMANSVICEVQGTYNALRELKWYQFSQLKTKVRKLYKKREKLEKKVFVLKEKVKNNQLSPSSLRYYKRQKAKIFFTNQKINRLKQKIGNVLKEIQSKNLGVCFGSKKMFCAQYHLKENQLTNHKVWLEKFRRQRDNRSLYIGSKTELRGNQLLQLTPIVNSGKGNSFLIQLRKNTKNKQYVRGICNFQYMSGRLAKFILNQEHGISYRIIFRENKCYLQAMIVLEQETKDCKTRKNYGTIGLDYNDGFVELAETNETGNLIKLKHIDLKHHGTGNKAKSEIREKVSTIVDYAISVGKDIIIENLNFKETKAETEKAKSENGKKYNKMIHAFDYSRYKKSFENCCFRRNVNLVEVNSAYTSKIAKEKYCKKKKLVIHQGASFVIARKGQGFIDKYIKKIKKKRGESCKIK